MGAFALAEKERFPFAPPLALQAAAQIIKPDRAGARSQARMAPIAPAAARQRRA